MEQYERFSRTITTQRVTKVEKPFTQIVRIPIWTQREADIYLEKGVAVYEETVSSGKFGTRIRHYIEVDIHDLADVARK